MTFLQIYLTEIGQIDKKSKELSFRTKLEKFFNDIKNELAKTHKDFDKIAIKQEPNNDKSGLGAPDFCIIGNGLTLGYIENKRVNADLSALIDEANKDEKAQIAKYLKLNSNLILTDYLRFWRVRKDEKGKILVNEKEKVQICTLDELKNLTNPKTAKHSATTQFLQDKEKELLDFFTLFFNATPKPINTALEFANALAQRTKYIKDSLQDFQTNKKIVALYNTFKETLDKDLIFSVFCDSFAQTLTYSLFLAKLNEIENKEIDLYNVKKFIPKSFPLIRAMSGFLDNLDELDSIKWLVKEILTIINHIDASAIIRDLNQISEKDLFGYIHKDPYLHFYETFLHQYDPKLQEIRGVYYTPFPVVDFIINAVDTILKLEFNQKGLNSALYKNSPITLLDFATGTGTFLLEAFRKALATPYQKALDKDIKFLIDKFMGFEFLIAPYTVAHLKISQALKEEFKINLKDDERLKIYLTNTLGNIDTKEIQSSFESMVELAIESKTAQEIKDNQILIITGNPPYNALSINKYDIESYKFCGLDKNDKLMKLKDRKHRLNDDYIKFIRFAQNKIDKQEQGIIAIITNNSFLDGATINGMRWHLLNSFNKIYLLNLHGDANKHETNPNGGLEQNVFDIKQGVCISIFIKKTSANKILSNKPQCEVMYYDLYGSRKEKYRFLLENNLNSIKWQILKPQKPHYTFIAQDIDKFESYKRGWSVKDIFIMQGLGVCTYRNHFCYTKSKEELKNRLEIFEKKDIEESRKLFNLPKDTRDWAVKNAKQEIMDTKNNPKYYTKVHFQPFDFRYTYFTGESKKFLGRPSGIQKQMLQENIGLVCDRGSKLKEVSNFFIANTLIDLHLVGSGSYIFPLYLYETKEVKKNLKKLGGLFENTESNPFDENEKIENFTQKFREFIDKKYQEHFSPELILGYIYAILFHKNYRQNYIDFLKEDFPKIPFIDNKEKFFNLSALGCKLIDLHCLKDKDLNENIGKNALKNETNSIIEKIDDYNPKTQELFINESLYFTNVSEEVWEYKIDKFQVLKAYLDEHKGENIDYAHFENVIKILDKSLKIQVQIANIELDKT